MQSKFLFNNSCKIGTGTYYFKILKEEFNKTEQTLKENLKDLLMKRASLSFQIGELRRGTFDYLKHKKEINDLDNQINSGAFAITTLMVDNRLFVTNVGPSHCFVFVYDRIKNERKIVSLQTNHSIKNSDEIARLADLKTDFSSIIAKDDCCENSDFIDDINMSNKKDIRYTRCLGDFKNKLSAGYIFYSFFLFVNT